ncbi:transaldolase family protein, partial [Moraxella sp.]|uniref:transaldolase family protein n=1 Tax=Moraxella sp. TaxID=479 RepID=UPI002604A387
MAQNSLTELAKHTTIVADTGDLSAIARLRPQDATTNPSLITAALLSGEHDDLIDQVKGQDVDIAIDHLTVALGKKISELNMISDDEKKKLLVDFNPAASDYPSSMTIAQLFEKQAALTPG